MDNPGFSGGRSRGDAHSSRRFVRQKIGNDEPEGTGKVENNLKKKRPRLRRRTRTLARTPRRRRTECCAGDNRIFFCSFQRHAAGGRAVEKNRQKNRHAHTNGRYKMVKSKKKKNRATTRRQQQRRRRRRRRHTRRRTRTDWRRSTTIYDTYARTHTNIAATIAATRARTHARTPV